MSSEYELAFLCALTLLLGICKQGPYTHQRWGNSLTNCESDFCSKRMASGSVREGVIPAAFVQGIRKKPPLKRACF